VSEASSSVKVVPASPPMIGEASLLLLEAWPTCHEWVWVVENVCHIGYVATPHQRSM
jgi:hypothetical protein